MFNTIFSFILNFFKSKEPKVNQVIQLPEASTMDPKPYLITETEILGKAKKEDMPQDHQDNLAVLLSRINKVRYAWDKPMSVTSGYRSKEDHIRIYKALASQRGVVYDETKVPMGSKHLLGAAVDISDSNGKLYEWVKNNVALMEEIGLWMEEADDQARVHFQIFPPKSGNRFFKP